MKLLGSKDVEAEKKPSKKKVVLTSPKKALEKIDEFNKKAKESEENFLRKEQEYGNRIAFLSAEVRTLESRKESALEPLEEKAADLDIRESILDERENELKAKEMRVEEKRQDNLNEEMKLKIVSDTLVRQDEEQDARENELDKKELVIEAESKKLQGLVDTYAGYVLTTEETFSLKKSELDRREAELNAVQDIQNKEWTKLNDEKKALIDGYKALEEAKRHTNDRS